MEIKEIIDLIKSSSQILLFIIITSYLIQKRSIIISSLWRRLLGIDLTFSDNKLSKAANELIDLEKFQVFYPNLKFKSIKQINDYIDWSTKKNISLSEANYHHECIKYLRSEKPAISITYPHLFRIERRITSVCTFLFLLLIALTLYLPALSGEYGRVLITTKTSGKYLYINNNRSIEKAGFQNEIWKLTASECKTQPSDTSEITQSEYNALCKLIQDKDVLNEYFEKTKKNGRIATAILIIILLPMLYGFVAKSTRLSKVPEFIDYVGGPTNSRS